MLQTLLRSALVAMLLMLTHVATAQESGHPNKPKGYIVPVDIEGRDTIPHIRLRTLHVFAPLEFKSEKERLEYLRLIRDVKRVLPFAKMVAATMKETYEYMETLPDERSRMAHLKRMEKELYKEYMPEMKKLTLRQGKLLIRLIDRQSGSSSYELVDAFLGGFAANFWNLFAGVFGASLKTAYDPHDKDRLTERVVYLVEYDLV